MAKAPLGSGGRFEALSEKLAARGARNPNALAAWIGRKRYGSKRMAELSAIGRRRAALKRKRKAKAAGPDEDEAMMAPEDEQAMMEARRARAARMARKRKRMALMIAFR
ncbi:MAG: hypothetical protein AB1760_00280 [Pseudomonadota bacterium]